VKHDWYQASAGDLIANIWLANPLKVALLSSAYVPNRDTHKLWSDVSAAQITGLGYTAGGQALTGKSKNYDAAADRTNLLAADNVWPDSTFSTAFAVVYDDSGGKPLWSLVDFEGTKDVISGVFTIDWATVGLLYVTV
jgi:hypothetical protein